MPLITASIGLATQAIEHEVDARWTMAYAASLGDTGPAYLDTTRADGVVAHPLFAICPEWPVVLASRQLFRERGLSAAEFSRAVHATHDTHIHRLIRPGDRLSTVATIIDIERRPPGAFVTTCFDTRDDSAALVCRTFQGTLFRDVELMAVNKAPVADLDHGIALPPPPPTLSGDPLDCVYEKSLVVAANFAHTYTECARIWNPIHTDAAAAQAAGLPGIILHGSATLALAVSALCARFADGEPAAVRRIAARFRGMVRLPSELHLRCFAVQETGAARVVPFMVGDATGASVLDQGSITLASCDVGVNA